jgi:2-dehydro-3-deoxy-D-gluconate 5-dehydrogenase
MVAKEFDLNGKIALIAGDSKNWAKVAAAALAEAGAEIAIAGKNQHSLYAAAKEAERFGKKALTVTIDAAVQPQVELAVKQVMDKFHRIDILVNAADVRFAKPFTDIKKLEWDKMLNANLTPVFNFCQVAGREMLKKKQGRIINITSCLAERGMINCSAYCTFSGGVLQLTRALGLEWAQQGITVNAIGAGWTAGSSDPQDEKIKAYVPLKRYGTPAEIGPLICYLASDAASFMTSEFITVDGAVTSIL